MTTMKMTAVLTTAHDRVRRGVVEVSSNTMASLQAVPGDTVVIRGTRETTAIVVLDRDFFGTTPALVHMDEITLTNAGVASGGSVVVERQDRSPASRVVLEGDPLVIAGLNADLVRTVLTGKPLTVGDLVSLFPQNVLSFDEVPSREVDAARDRVRTRLSALYTSARLQVREVSPQGGTIINTTELVLSNKDSSQRSSLAEGLDRFAATSVAAGVASSAALTTLSTIRERFAQRSPEIHRAQAAPSTGSFTPREKVPAAASVAPVAPVVPVHAAPASRPQTPPSISLSDLPHLEDQVKLLREWLDLGFNSPEILAKFGTRSQSGIILSVPEGSGEVDAIRALGFELGANVGVLSGSLLSSLEPAKALQNVIDELSSLTSSSPAVLVLTDIDALVNTNKPTPLLPPFLEVVKDTLDAGRVAIIATTSRLEEVTPQVRRPGLLEHLVSARIPDRSMRLRLLDHLVKGRPLASELSLDEVAARTPGFGFADLRSLVEEASRLAATRARDEAERGAQALISRIETEAAVAVDLENADGAVSDATPEVPGQEVLFEASSEKDAPVLEDKVEDLPPSLLTLDDFSAALTRVKPSVMQGSSLDVGSLTLDDVGGMDEVKRVLTETVLWPLSYPDTFSRMGITPPRGVLMYGPPGCGKTFLVRALAATGQANVFSVKGAELLTKYVGESEAQVRELFRKAREAAPSIVFLDEIDALAPPRGNDTGSGVADRVVAALLTELDGVEGLKDVVVIGATNRPDLVDPALLRPGRLEQMVYVSPPDVAAREDILASAAKNTPQAEDVDWELVSDMTEGFSSADCAALVRQSVLSAMRESMDTKEIHFRHIQAAIKTVRPSLNEEQVEYLESFAEALKLR